MRLDNDATHLADAQSRRQEAATEEKEVFGDPLLHPPEARPRTPAKGFVPGLPDPLPSALPYL